MSKLIDWFALWSDLVKAQTSVHQWPKRTDSQDHWQARAKAFDANVRRRWAQPDSSRAFIISVLDARPGSSLLDIGAGTGKWAVLLSPHAGRITALEPSPSMVEVLRENLAAENVTNVTVVMEEWPQAQVEPHDFTLCSHAMYGIGDFRLLIQRIQAVTRQMCFLLMRAPAMDGVMAEASRHVWGHPYDSPNYQIAINALWEMGIFPNVLMEDSGMWEPWTNDSLEQALDDIKRRLGLTETQHDDYLSDLLQRRLTLVDGKYVWPRAVRTAMLFWPVTPQPELRVSAQHIPRE